jgi:EcsC protein family
MALSHQDRDNLRYAKSLLEHPSLATRITNSIGTPIEKGFKLLPAKWSDIVTHATRTALQKALNLAVTTMMDYEPAPSTDSFHKIIVAVTGAGGGAFGLPALPIELSVSTTVMLRSIADIARSEGENMRSLETRLACIEVFALGGRSKSDDAAETGYFAIRGALARAVSEAIQYITDRGIAQESAPAIMRLIMQIATRFGVSVSEKIAAQAVPIIGAAGGAITNLIFIDHFQGMARGHFIVRRLERTYGPEVIRSRYSKLSV